MKDGDRIVIAYDLMKYTRMYYPSDKIATRIKTGRLLDSNICLAPIQSQFVYHTVTKAWRQN